MTTTANEIASLRPKRIGFNLVLLPPGTKHLASIAKANVSACRKILANMGVTKLDNALIPLSGVVASFAPLASWAKRRLSNSLASCGKKPRAVLMTNANS